MICLPSEFTEKLKTAIKNGKLNPERLNEMTSTQRRKFLAGIIGETYAKPVNLLFEQKLLLKNQEKAMYDFGRQITGISKAEKEALLAKIQKTYAEKKERLFDPKENENFLNEITSDIYSKKYKTDITLEESQTITELAQEVKIAKEELINNGKKGFGAAKVALDNYVGKLKLEAKKTQFLNPLKEQGTMGKVGAVGQDINKSINLIAENSRSIVASMDNSFWGRQGIKALMNPQTTKLWVKDFIKSWDDIGKTLKGGNKAGDTVLDGVKAEIYERSNYLNGRYEMGKKLDIGTGEEMFPTSLPSRIPVLGRPFKASEVSYEAGAMRLRADIADKFYEIAEKSGVDLTDKFEVGSINEIVNSMTGRGRLPAGEKWQKEANKMFFSIKFFKSNLDFLTMNAGSKMSDFARKQAAINLLMTIATTGTILKIAQALNPNDNKDIFNPTSSNFGKIRNGNMTFDLTGGAGGIVVTASKIISKKSTSTTTGITTQLGQGYGSQTGTDVFWNFVENKFSPMFSVFRDLARQKTFEGKKPTILGEIGNLTTPIIIQNVSQFKTESMAMQLIGLIADGLGLSVNAYTPTTDWGENTSKELQQFKLKVGETKFKEANDLYNKKYNEWLDKMKNNKLYNSLPDAMKQKEITSKKSEIKDKIFKQYGFTYKKEKLKPLPKF